MKILIFNNKLNFINKMSVILNILYISYINCVIVLFSVISIFFIPDKKYFEEKHFTDILKIKTINFNGINNDITSNITTIKNYTFIISEVINQMNSSKIINYIIKGFSYIHISLAIWSFLKDFANLSKNANIFYNSCLLLLSFLILIMALIILIKINTITKEYDYDNIGLTSEIKSRIIIIIILMSINLVIIFVNYFLSRKKEEYMEEEGNKMQDKIQKLKDENKNLQELLQKKGKEEIYGIDIKKIENEINKLKEEINNKNKELNEKKNNLYNDKNKNNKKVIAIIFESINHDNHYPIICKFNENFNEIEKAYPQYKNSKYKIGEKKIDRNKSIKENEIEYSDIITVYK